VVYDFQKFSEIRFREDLKSAGEDYLFWIEFAKRGARFVFSTRQEAVYGKGINVYSGAKWGSVDILRRIQNELEYRKSIEKVVSLNQEQQDFIKGKITELRESFLRALLHYMRHTRKIPLSLIWSQIGRDAKTLLLLPRLMAHKTLGFNRSKS
jgi:succinoglycan biosynthesis protein ExoW